MADEDEEPVIFYVHKVSGEKLWEQPPAGDEALYETWEYNETTGDVSQQQVPGPRPPPVGGPRPPSPGSRSASDDDGMDSRSESDDDEHGGSGSGVPLPRAKPPPPVGAGRGPMPPSGPAPPGAGSASASASDVSESDDDEPGGSGGAAAPGGRGPRPPPGPAPPMEPEPEAAYLETSLLAASREERMMREGGRTGTLTDENFDRLAEQDRARKLSKLHQRPDEESPKLRPVQMPKKDSFIDQSKYGVDEAIRDAATMDFATAILHDETCTVEVLPEHKVVLQQGKEVTYYAIDVAAKDKGEWRVYRRFRQFEKLHEWMKKSDIDSTAKDVLKNMFPGKTWREATAAEIETRKVRLNAYLKQMYADKDLKAQAQLKGSVFKEFLCHQGQDNEEGGGIRFSQFVRVMRVGVGNTDDDERWNRETDAHEMKETLIELMLQRGITSKESRDRTRDGTVGGASGRRLMAARAELELIEDIDELRALAVEEELDIPDEELLAERRYVWLEPYEPAQHAQTGSGRLRQAPRVGGGGVVMSTADSAELKHTQSVEESQKGTMLSFTEANEGESKAEIAQLVKSGERPAIRTMTIKNCKLNPDPKLRSCCAIELVLPEATVRFYTGSELAWIHWMGLLAPLLDRDLQSEYFDGQEFRGYVDQGVERLDARDLVPDHSRVGKAAEYADFTYGRVKRTFQENDPETMKKIKDAMDALGLDIDEAIRRVRRDQDRQPGPGGGGGVGGGGGGVQRDDVFSRTRLVSPGVRLGHGGTGVGRRLEKELGIEMSDGELRASMSVRKRRFSNADASLADMLSEEVIVVDVGSSYIRIGVGGEELPRKVVKMEGGRVIGGAKVKKGAYKGGSAGAAKRIEIDEDGLARIFDRVFHEMEIDPKNHKFVLTRFSDMNPETTAWIKEWLHEEFEVPCVAVVSTAAAILTASSRRTGIVLDIGNRAEVTAICHGADVSGAYKQFWFGGFDLTDKMQQLLARAQIDTSDLDLVRKIKEEHCRLRDHSEDEDLSTRPEAWDDEELHAMPTHRDIPREGLALAPPALWDCPVRARHSLPSLLPCPALPCRCIHHL
jgi:hypothetical protein